MIVARLIPINMHSCLFRRLKMLLARANVATLQQPTKFRDVLHSVKVPDRVREPARAASRIPGSARIRP